MINHARTLLLNRSGASRPPADFFLEEYVSPDFARLELPDYLQTLHHALVGENADDAWANFRMRQYTTLLHATEFASYVLDLDSRVTYLRENSTLDDIETRTAVPLNGLAGTAYILGTLEPSSGQPRLLYEWTVEMVMPLLARSKDLRTGTIQDTVITVADSLSSAIALAGQQDLNVKVEDPVQNAAWKVSVFAEPPSDLSALMDTLKQTGGATLGRLFAGASPYDTFKELWERHPFLSYQLSGLLLAFIYRAEGARVGDTA